MGFELVEYLSHQPILLYGFIFLFFFCASLSFPVPEEVLTIALGSLIFVSTTAHEIPIQPLVAALACTLGIFLSDLVVFYAGYRLNKWVTSSKLFRKKLRRRKSDIVRIWIEKYGFWAAGMFRFIPAMRWPGHLACGLFKVKPSHFAIADGVAALIYTPPQILLVSYYGDEILSFIKSYREISLIALFLIVFCVIFFQWRIRKRKSLSRVEGSV